jgi:hypothetical protein
MIKIIKMSRLQLEIKTANIRIIKKLNIFKPIFFLILNILKY